MAFTFFNKKGKKVILLNPAEKARKYADELANGIKLTNDGYIKFDPKGKPNFF